MSNMENKTLVNGVNWLKKDEKWVYTVSDITNNRLVILLNEWERLEGRLDVPEWTKVFIIANNIDTSVKLISSKNTSIRTYWLGNVEIRNAKEVHNKKIRWWAINQIINWNVINNNVTFVFNENVRWNVTNLNISLDTKNRYVYWSVVNKNSSWAVLNYKVDKSTYNESIRWNISNISVEEVINYDIQGDVSNSFINWNVDNFNIAWIITNKEVKWIITTLNKTYYKYLWLLRLIKKAFKLED